MEEKQEEEVDVSKFPVTIKFHPDTILQWLSGDLTRVRNIGGKSRD